MNHLFSMMIGYFQTPTAKTRKAWLMKVYNMVYPYSGVLLSNKKNEELIHATWMNLENPILSKRE